MQNFWDSRPLVGVSSFENRTRSRVRSPSFVNLGALEAMSVGHLLAGAIVILGTIDITMGEVDR